MTIRAICPHCERHITVRVTGEIRHHVNKGAPMNGPWRPRCPGSGWQVMTPEEVAREEDVQ